MQYFKVADGIGIWYTPMYGADEPSIGETKYTVKRHLQNGNRVEDRNIQLSEPFSLSNEDVFRGLMISYLEGDSRYTIVDTMAESHVTVSVSDEDYARMVLLDQHHQNVTIHYGIYVVDILFEKIEMY